MNLFSVCLVICVFVFINCDVKKELRNEFVKLPEKKLYNKFPEEEWLTTRIKIRNKKAESLVNGEIEKESTNANEFLLEMMDGKKEKRSNFAGGLSHIKEIYDQCSGKVNKRIEKLIKARVKSPDGKYLSQLKEYAVTLYECLKVFGFRYLDEILDNNFIPVTSRAYFIRDGMNVTDVDFGREISFVSHFKNRETINDYVTNVLNKDWKTLIYERLRNLLNSHSLKFHLGQINEGRSRRRDHRMFAMMVMGFMIMASILIPMGFQFLTVLGGKSLLMAKMALIMSAINGLKKIATSNVGYGFYHTGNDGHHHDHIHHGFHEKLFHVNAQNNPTQYGFSL